MRVVLDTNVWISGLLWKGAPMQVVRLAEQAKIEVWATQEILAELEESLDYERLARRLRELKLMIADVMVSVTALVSLIELDDLERVVPEDTDDDVFPNCARAVSAKYLISGNKHVLKLREWQGVLIVTPREFLEREFPETWEFTR